jgi:hypothetical protein
MKFNKCMALCVAGLSMSLLQACGGTATVSKEPVAIDFSGLEAYKDGSDFATLAEDLPTHGTTRAAMKNPGTASFEGKAIIALPGVSEMITANGDVNILVSFAGDGDVTGTVDNFDNNVTGSLTLGGNDSEFGENSSYNKFTTDYAGTLTENSENYTIAGELDGKFHGTAILGNGTNEMKGLRAMDTDGKVTGANTSDDFVIGIVAVKK